MDDIAVEYEKLMKPIEITNQIISVWPLMITGRDPKFLLHLRPVHRAAMFIILTILTISVTFDVVHHWGDMAEVTECSLIASAFYLSVTRITVYTIHEEDLNYVVKTMQSDWLTSTADDQLVLRDKCMFAFKLARHFIVTVAVAGAAFIVVPALEIKVLGVEEKKLPFRGYFYQNQTNEPEFWYIYVCNAIAGCFGVTTIMAATTLNLILVIHGAAKFAVVRHRLESLTRDDVNVNEKIADCVKQHQNAIFFAERVESTINILALGQFVISTGLVCFAGFQISAMLKDHGRLMKYCSFLNSAIFELFLFSYGGQQLIIESEAIGESSYASDWVGSSFTRNIQILMIRSLVPSKITAAKFYDMSLMSFTSVLSTSFSYFTVLQSVNEE